MKHGIILRVPLSACLTKAGEPMTLPKVKTVRATANSIATAERLRNEAIKQWMDDENTAKSKPFDRIGWRADHEKIERLRKEATRLAGEVHRLKERELTIPDDLNQTDVRILPDAVLVKLHHNSFPAVAEAEEYGEYEPV